MSASSASKKVWPDGEKYESLIKQYYQGIEYTHPDRVTSRRMCPCLEYTNSCPFPLEGKAEYIEYTGPNI